MQKNTQTTGGLELRCSACLQTADLIAALYSRSTWGRSPGATTLSDVKHFDNLMDVLSSALKLLPPVAQWLLTESFRGASGKKRKKKLSGLAK